MVQKVEYTIQCKRCGKQKTFMAYPGPTPKFCPECFEKFRRNTAPHTIESLSTLPRAQAKSARSKPQACLSFEQKTITKSAPPSLGKAYQDIYQNLAIPSQGTLESTRYQIGNFPA